ncbi:MAG: hypothetical protein ABR599_12785 [Gemmatimonadota bacterium]
MKRRPILPILLTVASLAACSGSAPRDGDGTAAGDEAANRDAPVLVWLDVRNESGSPVVLTARVGASPEQQLGFLGPGEYRRYRLPTGAAVTDDLVVRARGEDGREATTTLRASATDAAGVLSWTVPPI